MALTQYTRYPSKLEVEANAFAAEFLMPEDEIRAWAEDVHVDLIDDSVIGLKAKELGVSVQALSIRLEQLGCFKLDYRW